MNDEHRDETALGVNSEVGTLRTVIVHRPDIAHERLSPTNCHELLFDDVIWVRRARQEHDAFVDLMREAGVEVLLFHDLLAEALEDKKARKWILERRFRPEEVTALFSEPLTEWASKLPAADLATILTGGADRAGAARTTSGRRSAGRCAPTDFVLPPLPNQLFMRDTSAWLYGGVSINPMFWPARQHETLNLEAVYRFHPRFADAEFEIWYGGFDHNWGTASIEGGDMMPAGNGVVLVGMGERSTAKAVSILAQNMFAKDAARLVIGAQMPRERAAMHLDTVFTFCDRDVVTIYEPVVEQIVPILFTPDGDGGVKAEVSDDDFLDVINESSGSSAGRWSRPAATSSRRSATSGTTATTSSRSPRGRGRLRAQRGDQREARQGRGRGSRDLRVRARPWPRRWPLHDLPCRPRRLKGAQR